MFGGVRTPPAPPQKIRPWIVLVTLKVVMRVMMMVVAHLDRVAGDINVACNHDSGGFLSQAHTTRFKVGRFLSDIIKLF